MVGLGCVSCLLGMLVLGAGMLLGLIGEDCCG